MLERVDDTLWIADGELVSFYGAPYPTRSVIVRLESGDLWVWSPVKLTPRLRSEVDGLGPVRHLVSPNKLHHLYLQDWHAAYPEAQIWGPQSTIRKRRDLKFRQPLRDDPSPAWRGEIDQAWFRSAFLDEIIFFHRASSTVIVADLVQTMSDRFLREHWSWWLRGLAWLDGVTESRARAPLEIRLTFFNRADGRQARAKMLAWNCRRVIVAHGEWQHTNGSAFLAKSFSWLGA